MFPVNSTQNQIQIQNQMEASVTAAAAADDKKLMYKYKSFLTSQTATSGSTHPSDSTAHIDELLETEKKNMNSESWNRLDKRLKIQKLHAYAEKYGKYNGLAMKEIKSLKMFFSECLTKDKLAKVKDVEYDKQTGVIASVCGLSFNVGTRAFTLRNLDKKVSTLKSLTPKRTVDNDDDATTP
jgi:hypothetical protein